MKILPSKVAMLEKLRQSESFTLGCRYFIPAVIIGEEGEVGARVLPVQLLPESYGMERKGYTRIHSVEVGATKAGKFGLLQTEDADTTENVSASSVL